MDATFLQSLSTPQADPDKGPSAPRVFAQDPSAGLRARGAGEFLVRAAQDRFARSKIQAYVRPRRHPGIPIPSEGDAPTRHDFGEYAPRNIAGADLYLKSPANSGFQDMAHAEPLRHQRGIHEKLEHSFGIRFDH
jgi:hypothetical protein